MGKRVARIEERGQGCIIIPVQGVACQADGGGKGGSNGSETIDLWGDHRRRRRRINDLNYKLFINIIGVLVNKGITLVPVLEIDVEPLSGLACGRNGDDIGEGVGVGRRDWPDHRPDISVRTVGNVCPAYKHITGNCIHHGACRCLTVDKLYGPGRLIIVIAWVQRRWHNWILAVPDADVPEENIVLAAFAHIDDINVSCGCLLHLEETVTVGGYISSVNDKNALCGVKFVAGVLYRPCSYVCTVGGCGKVMYLNRREIIIGNRCVSPDG